MAWNTPKVDWETGELVAASDLNEIGENLSLLRNPPTAQYIRAATNYTTTSSSLVDVDATEGQMQFTMTTTGEDVLVTFAGYVEGSGGDRTITLAVDIDGTPYTIVKELETGEANMSFSYIFTGLAAEEHVFKLQWSINSGTATMYAGTTLFDVREILGVPA